MDFNTTMIRKSRIGNPEDLSLTAIQVSMEKGYK